MLKNSIFLCHWVTGGEILIMNEAVVYGKVLKTENNEVILRGYQGNVNRVLLDKDMELNKDTILAVKGEILSDEQGCCIGNIKRFAIVDAMHPTEYRFVGILKSKNNKSLKLILSGNYNEVIVATQNIEDKDFINQIQRGQAISVIGDICSCVEGIYILKAKVLQWVDQKDNLREVR